MYLSENIRRIFSKHKNKIKKNKSVKLFQNPGAISPFFIF